MEWFQIALEYLKVFLSTQVIAGIIAIVFFKAFKNDIKALILRIAKIRLPGGGELSTPQLEKLHNEKPITNKALPEPQSTDLQVNIQEDKIETVRALYNAERARAYFWEYSYLNYYLVPSTQHVLDWFASITAPVSLSLFDTLWLPTIPAAKERKAILDALEKHYLIAIVNELISVTPKGHEYIEWRGRVLQSPSNIF
jgi:hypothetical protein